MTAILGKSRDGQIARQLGSLVGDEAVQGVREATGGFYWPVPVTGGLPALSSRGEFYWRSMGWSRHLRGAPELPSLADLARAGPPMMGGTGFASLSDLISEATAGKQQTIPIAKVGSLSVAGATEVGWILSGIPGAGATPTAISSGGNVPTNATAGALGQSDAGGSDTLHLAQVSLTPQGNACCFILYDRIWHGATNTNSSSTQAISGTPPTRYATSGSTTKGNFAFPYSRSTVAATAHNHTVCQYKDQDNNTAESFASQGGNSGNVAGRVDFSTAGQWYMPLNSGDTGVKELTQWQFSAAMASGQIDLAIGHPLAIIPAPASGVGAVLDGINSAFNMVEVLDGACLDILSLRPATTATSYTGQVVMVSG